ncbi:RNA pyrophosphohydrolase [Thiolinea disciformis]|uniref:RNA pyrophosphohydrolase n=1 Tax=Thiolinea disciformis TaxID=125614 RepID=UPI00052784FB|nr:RNA pyrophosphohydrolase [Thiolinea disciformis]
MIDEDGFRANVGIILCNRDGKVFWGRRLGQDSWQFPQGGIDRGETPIEAMFRELREETGLKREHVAIIGQTRGWLRYRIPHYMLRRRSRPLCIGQKQRWFLLKMLCRDGDVNLKASEKPEFDHWEWVDYWHPAQEVVFFKRRVYRRALDELAPLLHQDA